MNYKKYSRFIIKKLLFFIMSLTSPFDIDFDIPLNYKDILIRSKDIKHINIEKNRKPIELPSLAYLY